MFKELGLEKECEKRIVILGQSLQWAGGPTAPSDPAAAGLIRLEDLLSLGTLPQEENFDGQAHVETAVLCYSSVNSTSVFYVFTLTMF